MDAMTVPVSCPLSPTDTQWMPAVSVAPSCGVRDGGASMESLISHPSPTGVPNEIRSGVDDRLVELKYRLAGCPKCCREPLGLGVEAHTNKRVGLTPAPGQLRHETFHAARLRFFRCTSSIETAAAVTPGMRDA